MAEDEQEDEGPDRVCMHCGEILSGPNAGDKIEPGGAHIPLPEGVQERTHKGRKLSHCGGHGCQEEMDADLAWYQEIAQRQEAKGRSKRSIAAQAREDKKQAGGIPKIRPIASGPRVNPEVQARVSEERSRKSALKKLNAWQQQHSTREK